MRKGNTKAVWKNKRRKKGKGKKYLPRLNIQMVGKNIKWERKVEGLKIWEENQDLENGGGEEYQL